MGRFLTLLLCAVFALSVGVMPARAGSEANLAIGYAKGQVSILQQVNQYAGWSVVSDRPMNTGSLRTSSYGINSRIGVMIPFNAVAIRAGFDNKYNVSAVDTPGPNAIGVRASWEALNVAAANATGANVNQSNATRPQFFSFGGRETALIPGGGFVLSDPLPMAVPAFTRNFINSLEMCSGGAAPAAPTAAASAGSGIAAGTYLVGYTIVDATGAESQGSSSTSVTTSSTNLQITITSPSASTFPGARGYRPIITTSGGSVPYDAALGVVPFGTNAVLFNVPHAAAKPYTFGSASACTFGGVATGGTGAGSSNSGEATVVNLDFTGGGYAGGSVFSTTAYSPFVVLALDPVKVHNSFGIAGDSIAYGIGDNGFTGIWGGAATRAMLGQTTARAYDPTVKPVIGHLNMAISGQFQSNMVSDNGKVSRAKLALATDILNDACINDLSSVAPASATCLANQVTWSQFFTAAGKHTHTLTLFPRTNSSDGFTTVANQSGPNSFTQVASECARRQYNNALRSTASAAQTITNENLCGAYAAWTPSTNFYGGGDGTATIFQTAYPFVEGTEVIKVNGVTKALTTDYTYAGAATINGVTYAAGVTFVTAPANAATVTASYTGSPNFTSLEASGLSDVWDWSAGMEVNAAGTQTINGGFWKAAASTGLVTGTSSGSNTSITLNDTSKTWTQDQWRGYTVTITADSTAPTAVGQTEVINANTTTQLQTTAWTVTPDAAAVYSINDAYTLDGTHPSTLGAMTAGAAIAPKVAARVN